MKSVICLFIFMIFISSCAEDKFENMYFTEFSSSAENSEVLIVNSLDDFNSFIKGREESVFQYYDHSPYISSKGFLAQGVKGYSRKIVRQSLPKMQFGKDMANKIGVNSSTIYSVQYLTIEADIDTEGKKFFSYPSWNCGGMPVVVNGKEDADYDHMGYSIRSIGNPTVLATHLIYVDCTFPQGSAVKKYYPRSPKDLEWNYNLY